MMMKEFVKQKSGAKTINESILLHLELSLTGKVSQLSSSSHLTHSFLISSIFRLYPLRTDTTNASINVT